MAMVLWPRAPDQGLPPVVVLALLLMNALVLVLATPRVLVMNVVRVRLLVVLVRTRPPSQDRVPDPFILNITPRRTFPKTQALRSNNPSLSMKIKCFNELFV